MYLAVRQRSIWK